MQSQTILFLLQQSSAGREGGREGREGEGGRREGGREGEGRREGGREGGRGGGRGGGRKEGGRMVALEHGKIKESLRTCISSASLLQTLDDWEYLGV